MDDDVVRPSCADALHVPEIVSGVLAAYRDGMLESAPTWDDWVDERAARMRLGELATVCRAWRGAQRLHRSIWLADRDAVLVHAAEVETIVFTSRSPEAPTRAAFQHALDVCPRATSVYCHKPPIGLVLPARVTSLYTTGLATDLVRSGTPAHPPAVHA